MPISKRGASYQVSLSHKGNRYRKSFPDYTSAQAWELETKAKLLRGAVLETSDGLSSGLSVPTLADLLRQTYQLYWSGKASAKVALGNAERCLECLGANLPIDELKQSHIDHLILSFEAEGIASSTINRRLSALSKVLSYAFDRGLVGQKFKLTRQKEPMHRIRYITDQEEADLLSYFSQNNLLEMISFYKVAVDTGLRLSELLRIDPQRDIHQGLLSVWQTKNGKPRSVPLTQRAERALNEHPFMHLSQAIIRGHWEQAKQALGLSEDKPFVLHTLRHTFCSRLVQRGVDILRVSILAGHSSLTVTQRYAHLAPQNLQKFFDLEQIFLPRKVFYKPILFYTLKNFCKAGSVS